MTVMLLYLFDIFDKINLNCLIESLRELLTDLVLKCFLYVVDSSCWYVITDSVLIASQL